MGPNPRPGLAVTCPILTPAFSQLGCPPRPSRGGRDPQTQAASRVGSRLGLRSCIQGSGGVKGLRGSRQPRSQARPRCHSTGRCESFQGNPALRGWKAKQSGEGAAGNGAQRPLPPPRGARTPPRTQARAHVQGLNYTWTLGGGCKKTWAAPQDALMKSETPPGHGFQILQGGSQL